MYQSFIFEPSHFNSNSVERKKESRICLIFSKKKLKMCYEFSFYPWGFIYCINFFSPPHGLDDRRFESWEGMGIFLFTTASRLALGLTRPPIRWVPGALSLGVKRLRHDADHTYI